MRLKILFLILVIARLSGVNAMAATTTFILDCNSGTCVKKGKWEKSDLLGYNRTNAFQSDNGAVEWSDKSVYGLARVSYWATIDEEGASGARLEMRTEHVLESVDISFCEGNSGWREVGWIPVTGGGLFLTLNSGTGGKSYVSAIKLEYVDDIYRSLDNFVTTYPEHIIFGTHSSIGYKNSQKIDMKDIPKIDVDNAYVSKEAIFRYLGAYVEETSDTVTIKIGDKQFQGHINDDTFSVNGKTIEGSLAVSYDDKTVVNIIKIAQNMGKETYISKRGLVVIADRKVFLDEKTDKKDINNILTVLRNEKK